MIGERRRFNGLVLAGPMAGQTYEAPTALTDMVELGGRGGYWITEAPRTTTHSMRHENLKIRGESFGFWIPAEVPESGAAGYIIRRLATTFSMAKRWSHFG